MDSEEILCCLKKLLKSTRVKKIAVIARDEFQLISFHCLPMALVTNTDVSTGPGIHWTGWYITRLRNNNKIVARYFDSYGNSYKKYNFQPRFRVISWSHKVLQSDNSQLCGAWVCAWLLSISNGMTTKQFENKFGDNLVNNDREVKKYILNIKNKKIKLQTCCSRAVNKL